jgi:hypothetical protein
MLMIATVNLNVKFIPCTKALYSILYKSLLVQTENYISFVNTFMYVLVSACFSLIGHS